jgi:hypothetical protein
MGKSLKMVSLHPALPGAKLARSSARTPRTRSFHLRPRQDSVTLLHFPTLAARKILDPSARGFERVMDHQLKIGMWRLGLGATRGSRISHSESPVNHNRLALNYNFLARQGQIDANVERFALLVVAVRELNRHAASDDTVVKSFEFPGLCSNAILYFVGMFHVTKRNLQWNRHGPLP